MDFWKAQRKARRKTNLYLAVFIVLTLIVAGLVEYSMRWMAPHAYHPDIPTIGFMFLGVTFAVAGFQYWMYSKNGGSYVAESVGARKVDPYTSDPHLRQLMNIVEEMALAAHLPMPAVYVMESHQINAFAAGLSPDKAAIAITYGTLEKLNRDEIQGVIAHEFGHIYNGDMKISLQLAAMVMGFYFILYFGLRALQISRFRGGGRSAGGGRGGNIIVLTAMLMIVAGIFTWFFGSILKSMVSRQREYLADACSVQFTRNPSGIANALRKIGKDHDRDMPPSGMAYSHMYLDDKTFMSGLFATHPPLKKRIEAIESREYIPPEWEI